VINAPETALITGANRGLGLGLARMFVQRGWRVFGTCRRPKDAAELTGAGVEAITVDVGADESVAAAGQTLTTRLDRIDVLINNAGINPGTKGCTVAEVPVAVVGQAVDVNLLGSLRMLQVVLPLLRRSERPRVINISSGAGSLAHNSAKQPVPAYSISKAALNMLTRCAARDLPNITVVSIAPGWIRTDMGGQDAALSVTDAAEALTTTIENLTLAQSGQWLDRFGDPSEYAW
jgi:NAD(P)-dependent dehydrogenase (short-subunit alcohol dehydrogenase family)